MGHGPTKKGARSGSQAPWAWVLRPGAVPMAKGVQRNVANEHQAMMAAQKRSPAG